MPRRAVSLLLCLLIALLPLRGVAQAWMAAAVAPGPLPVSAVMPPCHGDAPGAPGAASAPDAGQAPDAPADAADGPHARHPAAGGCTACDLCHAGLALAPLPLAWQPGGRAVVPVTEPAPGRHPAPGDGIFRPPRG